MADEKILKCFEKIVSDEEYSEKSLNLTTCAIRQNPFNYNFWIFRKKILQNIQYDAFKELCWLEEMIIENPKNFLCWEHRKIIMNKNPNCCTSAQEFKLTEFIFSKDSKNYHAWNHRQFTINTFKYKNLGLLSDELRFTSKMIDEDVRNNSAWNQRYFIINLRGKTDFILVKNEFKYTFEKIKLANENDSAWNYMRGLLLNFGAKKLWQFQDLVDFCEREFYDNENTCRHIVAFLIDLRIEMVLDDANDHNELLLTQKVFNLCQLMSHKYDKIRKNYWQFVYKQFCYDKILKRDAMNDTFRDTGGAKKDESWKVKLAKRYDFSEAPNINDSDKNKNQKKSKKKSNHKAN